VGTGVRGGKIRPEYILILSESILVTLLRFDGARELFLAVVFVSGRFFKCAYCVRPAGRCPSVQHHEDDLLSGDFGDVVAGLARGASQTVVFSKRRSDDGGNSFVRQIIVE